MSTQPVLQVEFGQSGTVDALPVGLQPLQVGSGWLAAADTGLRLTTTGCSSRRYSNAQLDDYRGRARRNFLWRPPLRLTVRARFSHEAQSTEGAPGLRGTAGFGFWNDPFMMTTWRVPALPRAIWFFYASPPSDMKLDSNTPGCGWKAATIDAHRWPALPLVLTAPAVVLLMNWSTARGALWPHVQRALRVSEATVPENMTEWHDYVIEWGYDRARFQVDHTTVLDCDTPPRGALGLVIWLDNQFLVVNPRGRLRSGLLATSGAQWLEIGSMEIRSQESEFRSQRPF